jgi:predicted porin
MTAFSSATQDVSGFQQGLGIGDSSNVTNGVALSARPIGSRPEALALAATYLSGKDPGPSKAGSGAASSSTQATQGKAGDILADSQLLQRRLRLRGEYAWTEFDFDGAGSDTDANGVIDSNLKPTRDSAYEVLATYTPWHDKLIDNQPFAWVFGVQQSKIGTFFRSPAAPSGISDRAMVLAFTSINWSGLDAQLSLANATDNVNDLDLMPRTRTGQRFASLAYTPQINQQPLPDGRLPGLPWYGQPTFSATYTGSTTEVDKAGGTLSTGPLNDLSTWLLSATFNYATWNWTANYTNVDVQNHIGDSADTNTNSVGLNANFRFAEKLTLTPRLQYSLDKQRDPPAGSTATDTATTTAGIDITYTLSERMVASLNYNLHRLDTPCCYQDTRSEDIGGSLTWMAVLARESTPGVSFALRGAYHDEEDRTAVVSIPSKYEIFLTMSISWAPSL